MMQPSGLRRLIGAAFASLSTCMLLAICGSSDGTRAEAPDHTHLVGALQPVESLTFQQGLLPGPSYAGVQDTYLNLWADNATHYTDLAIVLRSDGAQRPLLRFDLSQHIPAGSDIVQATLYLWVYYANPYSTVIDASAHRVFTPWAETTATWNDPWTLPGCGEPTDRETVGTDEATLREPGLWVSWDVTTAAEAWALDPGANQGVLIVCPPGQAQRRAQFRSSEYSDLEQRPKLVVQYHSSAEPTQTATPTITPTPTTEPGRCILHGQVNLQRPGRPAPHASWAITVTVSIGGADHSLMTDQLGHFALPALSPGTFDIGVKHAHTLRNVASGVALAPGDNPVDFGMLREGDANDDNCVNITDFSIFASAFAPQYRPEADFDLDGNVNITDFSLLASSFGRCGD
jgi:hypothetical protein